MNRRSISGRKRLYNSFIEPFQQLVVKRMVPKIPAIFETYVLTLSTLVWSLAAIGVGYLARQHIVYIVLLSIIIFVQYVTDILDGAVGRYRRTGLVQWGFYMDHLLDFVFACSLMGAYAIALRWSQELFLVGLIITSGYFVHELLLASIRGELNTSGYYGFGPTEIRLFAIVLNFVIPLVPATDLNFIVLSTLPLNAVIFAILIYKAQLKLWKSDMEIRNKVRKSADAPNPKNYQ